MQKPKPLDTHLDAPNDVVAGEHLEEEEEEEDVEQLEESVVEMAQQVLDYRTASPAQLKTTLASLLDSPTPLLPPTIQPHSHPNTDAICRGSANEASLTEEDPEDIKKLELLKQKISANASDITVALKRMRECMDKMDKLQSQKGVIHPAFKKKMLTD